MALEYRLTLAGMTPIEVVAARAIPDPATRPIPYEKILTADLYAEQGFDLTVAVSKYHYYGAIGDSGLWEWEPDACVDIIFRMDKDPDRRDMGIRNMLGVVRRVLASGDEDAALVLNSDYLLLTRFGGVVAKHRRATWWDHYGWVNEII